MAGPNLLVFRDDAKWVHSESLIGDIAATLKRIRHEYNDQVTDTLLMAGQLEAALWDCGSPQADAAASLTTTLARAFIEPVQDHYAASQRLLLELADSLPQRLRISEPEGFSYYALHPGDFADIVAQFQHADCAAVVGIRSIGTTLSAVAIAEFQRRHVPASRITVRPLGHPYNRTTTFTPSQSDWIKKHRGTETAWLVMDEGPGLSGSSFLSVAEALVNSGVPAGRITLIGTRNVDPTQLCATDAARRWNRFACLTVSSRVCKRFVGFPQLNGGHWREVLLPSESAWPACWTDMESLRFLSPDRTNIYKFEGFGRYGQVSRERANAVHQAGFGPEVESAGDGISRYRLISGKPLTAADLSSEILDRMAHYCAFRTHEFKAGSGNSDALQRMAEFNLSQETDGVLGFPSDTIASDSSVVVDARMQPHKWVRERDGTILKVDTARHGDDHFLPGPTDIAWDLAGAIVEWAMSREAAHYFIERFCRISGRTSAIAIAPFTVAYCAFRLAYSQMALATTHTRDEILRLERARDFYRQQMNIAHGALSAASELHTLS